MTKVFFYYLCICFFSVFSLAFLSPFLGNSWAKGPRPVIEDISLAKSNHHLVAYMSLENPLNQETIAVLKSGIQIRLTFQVEIKEPSFPFDKIIAEKRYSRILKYDNLKKDYMMVEGPPSPRVVTVNSMEEFKNLAFNLNKADVLSLNRLTERKRYIFRAKASLEIIEGSRPFEGLLNFFSSDKIETEWHEIPFTY